MAKKLAQRSALKREHKSVASVDILKGNILYDNILLKPIVVEKEGLVLRPQQYEDKPEWGEVIACGEGRIFDNGTVIPLKVNVGDMVLFQKYSAQKFRHGGDDYIIIREEDIYLYASK